MARELLLMVLCTIATITITMAAAPSQCTTYTSCQACTEVTNCGYCAATGTCDSGSVNGSADGTCTSTNWLWGPSACPSADPCQSYQTCGSCLAAPASLSCGYCQTSGLCLAGTATGPTVGQTCAAADWYMHGSTCPTSDPCTQYNASCSICTTAPQSMSCGWCTDTSTCTTGIESGPSVGSCSVVGWSLQSCGASATCQSTNDCFTCLEQNFDSCGWCKATQECAFGNAEGPTLIRCPENQWNFNSDFSGLTLQCYLPTPYEHPQTKLSTLDYVSYTLLGVIALLFLSLTLAFSCCGCSSCIPIAGDGHKSLNDRLLKRRHQLEHEHEPEDYDEDDPEGISLQGCCQNANNGCAKFCLWIGCILTFGLSVASLATDLWSMSVRHDPQLSSDDNPLSTAEGTVQSYVWLGRDHHDGSSFNYDCNASSKWANLECWVHYASGIATLCTGALSAVFTGVMTLMATSDFCCAPQFTPSASAKYNPIHILKIRYPFSSVQWRCAVLGAIYAYLSAAIFGCGCFLLSQQYFSHTLQLHISFYLMCGSAFLATLIALAYRRAVRVTPRDGYPVVAKHSTHSIVGSSEFRTTPLNSALGYPTDSRPVGGTPRMTHTNLNFHHGGGVVGVGGVLRRRDDNTFEDTDQGQFQYQSFSSTGNSFGGQHLAQQQYIHQAMMAHTQQQQASSPILSSRARQASIGGVGVSGSITGTPTFGSHSNLFMQVPWSAYAGDGPHAYQPPPGYVLVPAAQAEQYLNPTNTTGNDNATHSGDSNVSMPEGHSSALSHQPNDDQHAPSGEERYSAEPGKAQ